MGMYDSSEARLRTNSRAFLLTSFITLPLLICFFSYLYYSYFAIDFNNSFIPFYTTLAIGLGTFIGFIIQYFFNREKQLTLLSAYSVIFMALFVWVAFGSMPYFYFLFGPLTNNLKTTGTFFVFGITFYWLWRSWNEIQIVESKYHLSEKMFYDDEEDGVIYYLGDRKNHLWNKVKKQKPLAEWQARIILGIASMGTGAGIIINRLVGTEMGGGAHGTVIVLSILGMPLSLWLLRNFVMRSAYFGVYKVWQMEKKTGKRVVNTF